jgi:hypothetical protein
MPRRKGSIVTLLASTALLCGVLAAHAAPPETVVPLPQKPLSPAQVTTALQQAKPRIQAPAAPFIVPTPTIDQAAIDRLIESYRSADIARTKTFESQFQSAAASQNVLAANRAAIEAAQLRQQMNAQALTRAAQLDNFAQQQRTFAMLNTHDANMSRIDAQNARVSANLAATEAFLMQHRVPPPKPLPFTPSYGKQ